MDIFTSLSTLVRKELQIRWCWLQIVIVKHMVVHTNILMNFVPFCLSVWLLKWVLNIEETLLLVMIGYASEIKCVGKSHILKNSISAAP